MVIGTVIAAGISILVTGAVSYFAFKPASTHNETTAVHTAGSIKNNVTIEEKTDALALFTITLLIFLVMFKFVEVCIVSVTAFKRTMKKKYSARQQLPFTLTSIATPAMNYQPTANPAPAQPAADA